MKNTLITFKTAELAKEKGFHWKVFGYYSSTSEHSPELEKNVFSVNHNIQDDFPYAYYSAPSQSLLQRWLREEYDVIISIFPSVVSQHSHWGQEHSKVTTYINAPLDFKPKGRLYEYCIWDNGESSWSGSGNSNYEDALEEALIQALKLIKT